MELFIPMDALETYAGDTAAALAVHGAVSGQSEARRVREAMRVLEKAQRCCSSNGAGQWLRDNLYLARQAASDAAAAFRAAKRLRASGGRALIVRCAQALIASGDGAAETARIETFLPAFTEVLPLSSRELGLLPAALRLTLVESLASVYAAKEPSEHRAGALFTSLREVGALELAAVLERADPVDRLLRQDPVGIYPRMDEESRADYRRQVARLAAKERISGVETVNRALTLSQAGANTRTRHVGFYLFDRPLGKRAYRPSGIGYSAWNLALPAALATALGIALRSFVGAALAWLPLTELVKGMTDRYLLRKTPPRRLPRMDLSAGIPPEGKTLCVISVLLTGADAADRSARRLEELRMAELTGGENLLFGLVCDLPESREFLTIADRALLEHAAQAIRALNERYGGGFFLFTRDRVWNRNDRVFLPWERKRGATLELCRLLGGEATHLKLTGDISELRDVSYLLTLDSDSRPEPGGLCALIAAALHPLNRPAVDRRRGLVVRGHGLLQPRLGVDLPSAGRSSFARLFSPPGGTDPYGACSGELYMDRYASGGFAGKGLIHIRSYLACLGQRIPEGLVLSHDALEGAFLRGGLVDDVEFTDAFPSTLLGYFSRSHRWIRGDWQNLPWLFRAGRDLPWIERWRLLDSLRRSLLPPALLGALLLCLAVPDPAALAAAGISLLVLSLPCRVGGFRLRLYTNLPHGLTGAAQRFFARFLFLPYEAWISLSAIGCALWRMGISHRRLLAWKTAEQGETILRGGAALHYRAMWANVLCGALLLTVSPLILGLAVGVVWMAAPALGVSLGREVPSARSLAPDDAEWLRRRAAEMWRYFHRYCAPETHYLPPDNVQESPPAPDAERVSPTNLGLTLLGVLCARELGLCPKEEAISLAGHILSTAERMVKWHGHLCNWYDTRTLAPLEPRYVSTVDSGNLAACLIASAAALTELGETGLAWRARSLYRAMDFRALYDPRRHLFVIGRAVDSDAPPTAWYDLLESEQRLTAYIAVASGQAERRHWRRLSRAQVGCRGFRGMVSWSGTMFEYLMPELFLPLFRHTHLEESARFAVCAQQRHPVGPNHLWGVSESAFASLDSSGHYRYKAHGTDVLALAQRRESDAVAAPYASYLALAISPRAAVRNLRKYEQAGRIGPYGFWDAIDFTPGRAPKEGAAIRCVMVHHLGMSLAAVTNALCRGAVRRWFLSDPAMAAHTALLQEKIPLRGALLHARRTDPAPGRSVGETIPPRRGEGVDPLHPQCAALSNGSYHLLVWENGVTRSSCGGLLPYVSRRGPTDRRHGIELWLRQDSEWISLLPEADGESRCSWEFTSEQASLRIERGGIGVLLTAGTAATLPGEWRGVEIHRGEAAPAGELFFSFEPMLIGEKDYAAHPSFARLGISTQFENGILTIRRLARGRQREQFLAVGSDRAVEFSSDFQQFPSRSGNGDFRPGGGWQSECCVTGRVILPAGERESHVRFGLCMAGDALSAAHDVKALLHAGASSGMVADVCRLGLDSRDFNEAMKLASRLARPFLPASAAAAPACRRDALWKNGLSGDRPIWAVECAQEQSVPAALVQLRRFALLQGRGVDCEIVFLTGEEGDYRRACRAAIEEAMGRLSLDEGSGVRFASLKEDGEAMRSVAAVWIGSSETTIPARRSDLVCRLPGLQHVKPEAPTFSFAADGSFSFSAHDALPPRSWALPLCGGDLGYMASDAGTGALWYKNARECPLIPWRGDPLDTGGPELLWCEVNGRYFQLFSAQNVTYRMGEAVWETTAEGVTVRVTAFLPPEKSVRVFLLESSLPVQVFWCAPLQMAPEPEDALCCYVNFSDGMFQASNPRCTMENVTLYARCSEDWTEVSTDAAAFVYGASTASPRSAAPAFCGSFTLCSRAVVLCGTEDVPELLAPEAAEKARSECRAWWQGRIGRLHGEGLPEGLAPFLNGWSAYQALSCRIMGRSSMYQSGGAVGFRDQMQDHVNLLWLDAPGCRAHIVACCAHQFTEGDVQHWWHPGEGTVEKGVRTRCSDDLLWLPWAVCEYVRATGDLSVCLESAPYLTAVPLSPEENSRYELPSLAEESGTVLDHCRRALYLVLNRGTGAHRLLLMGSGDWNDGFDAMGPGSESVWLTWFASTIFDRFGALLRRLSEPDAKRCAEISHRLGEAANEAWDGDHFLRGYYGDGTPLGAASAEACRIDSVAQSFAAFCPHADPARVRTALETALRTLRDPAHHLTLLYTPPFSPGARAPGYVKTYGPGFRENGGQYTHAAVWLARACFAAGLRAEGRAILEDIVLALRESGCEPFVIPADVYTAPGQKGRGGWSWYTGAAGWWYRTVWEELLGFRMLDGAASFAPPEEVKTDVLRLRYEFPDGTHAAYPEQDSAT